MSPVALRRFQTEALRVLGRTALVSSLTFIGFVVGVGCVILPLAAPFGIVALAAVILLWAAPDRHTTPGQLQRFATLVFYFSIISIPSYFTLVFPGLPWISLRRLALVMFATSTIVTFATSKEHRAYLALVLMNCKPATYLLFLLIALWAASVAGSAFPAESINNIINQHLVWLLSMLAAIAIFRTKDELRRLIFLITACCLLDFGVGFIEFLLKRPFLFYVVPASMREQLIATNGYLMSLLSGSGIRNGLYRAASVFTGPLSWGEMAAIVAPLGAYFLSESRTITMRFYGVLVVICCFLSIYFSGSRGAYVGFIASIMTYALLWAFRNVRTRPKSLSGGIILVLFFLGSVSLAGSVFFVDRINKTVLGNSQAQVSTEARTAQWNQARPYVLARPVVGYGVGMAAGLVNYSAAPGAPVSLDSYVITLLVEMGIPGLLSYMGFFIFLICRCAYIFVYRLDGESGPAAGICCALISYILYRLTLSQIDNNYLAFAIAGIAITLIHLQALPRQLGTIVDASQART
ncbi:O-antigen ligase family protein [Lichenihabitans sp. Uapishka_5]|uniref:O-antigen ligase family protein n=1 Tax=Lichenihabitans sp. Uapishka_5 TaxID=3037302 RepID=UPI0029E7DE56|nr:O-antigen ligase family protein [Lichenihabitans sp. Uapishka_5]MDX7953438.1 O-antigen ligase family protein [Lichenihabitans sp. Uapishka_5]